MMTVDPRTLTRLLANPDTPAASCPTGETLAQAAAPDADQRLREQVADHLIGCATCAEDFRLAQEVVAWADAAAARDSARADTGHSRIRLPERRGFTLWMYVAAGLTAAAMLVVVARGVLQEREQERRITAIAGASAQLEQQLADAQRAVADLRQQLAQTDSPRLNTPILELTPIATTRSGHAPATSAAPIRVPADARDVILVLNTSNPRPGATHDIEIVGADDRLVWRGTGVTQSAHGTMTLVVPRALLDPHETIRLYEPVRHRLLDQYLVPALIP